MNKEEFKELLTQAKLTKREFSEILNINLGSMNNWGSTQNIPYWVESWLDNYIRAKNYNDMRDFIIKREKLYPIIIEKILAETDERYLEEIIHTYNETKDVEQTIHMVRIASSINSDTGHLIGCSKDKIKKLHDYLEAKKFKPSKEDEKIIVDFMNTKNLDL